MSTLDRCRLLSAPFLWEGPALIAPRLSLGAVDLFGLDFEGGFDWISVLRLLLSILKIQSFRRLWRRVHLDHIALAQTSAWVPALPCLFILCPGQVVTQSLSLSYLMGDLSCRIIFEMANSALIHMTRSVKCQLSFSVLMLASCQSWIIHICGNWQQTDRSLSVFPQGWAGFLKHWMRHLARARF